MAIKLELVLSSALIGYSGFFHLTIFQYAILWHLLFIIICRHKNINISNELHPFGWSSFT